MTSETTDKFWKSYDKLPQEIKSIAKKQYQQFEANHFHPSLDFKRIHSTEPIYSARVTKDYRALGVVKDSVVIWFWIGTHIDYEKLLKRL